MNTNGNTLTIGTAKTYGWLGDYDNTGTPSQQVIWMDDLPVGILMGASTAQALHYIEAMPWAHREWLWIRHEAQTAPRCGTGTCRAKPSAPPRRMKTRTAMPTCSC